MKKMFPFILGSLLLLGATACSEKPDSTATNGSVRKDQIASDARARDQRDGKNSVADDKQQAAATADGVRKDQIASDTRARDQRDGKNSVAQGKQQTTGDLAVDVRNSLESKLPGSRLAVNVDGANGMATIDGTVLTQTQFNQIEPLAMAFEGVKSVDVKAKVNPN